MKPRYVPPTVEKITDEYIDSIAPLLMSCGGIYGGGGGSSSSYRTIYVLNNPTGLPQLGHSALLLQDDDGVVELFSFHPYDNKTANAKGSVASIARSVDARTFAAFKAACLFDGVLVNNLYMQWNELFARYVKLTIAKYTFNSIRSKAVIKKSTPPHYNAISYNCQHFVTELLASGGITLRSRGEPLTGRLIPNNV